jgi:hypothetical protein
MFAESAVGVHKDLAAFSAFDGKMAHVLNREGMKVGW